MLIFRLSPEVQVDDIDFTDDLTVLDSSEK